MNGLLLVDKPSGPSSFEMVRLSRRAARTRKVGHAGTLDPLASGLLVVCIDGGTKLVPFLMDSPKVYEAEIALGAGTDTDDSQGRTVERAPVPSLEPATVEAMLARFTGRIEQVPPAYSALKRNGEALYKKARRGERIEVEARDIFIESIEIIDLVQDRISLRVTCGKGTYIRALARDLARSLGTVGHLTGLRRFSTSGFQVARAATPDRIRAAGAAGELQKLIIPLAEALPHWPRVHLSTEEETLVTNGNPVPLPESVDASAARVLLLRNNGDLAALARLEQNRLQPFRVFNS